MDGWAIVELEPRVTWERDYIGFAYRYARETAAALLVGLASPPTTSSFQAPLDNGWIPPDTHGAVGPNHLVVVHNGLVRVQPRSGTNLGSTDLFSFWLPVETNSHVFDPTVLYDPPDSGSRELPEWHRGQRRGRSVNHRYSKHGNCRRRGREQKSVTLSAVTSAFTSANRKSPAHCAVAVDVDVVGLGGDSNPSNSSAIIDLEVVDKNDF